MPLLVKAQPTKGGRRSITSAYPSQSYPATCYTPSTSSNSLSPPVYRPFLRCFPPKIRYLLNKCPSPCSKRPFKTLRTLTGAHSKSQTDIVVHGTLHKHKPDTLPYIIMDLAGHYGHEH